MWCCLGQPVLVLFFTMARRKLGNLQHDKLKEFVYKRVFLSGLGSLPPMIYLTTETVKCHLDHVSKFQIGTVMECIFHNSVYV